MRYFLLFVFIIIAYTSSFSQSNERLSSIDFIAVLNNYHAEALYYYQNNWKALREAALKKGYIQSYNFIEIEPSEIAPYNFILITTYANSAQYEGREKHFNELIKASGGLKLLNTKEPKAFRQVVHGQDSAKTY